MGSPGPDPQIELLCTFILGNKSYQLVFTVSKNIVPSQVIACQSWACACNYSIEYARKFQTNFPKNKLQIDKAPRFLYQMA